MRQLFEGPGFWIILVLAIVIFGGAKLPGIAKNLGQSMRVFRKEMKNLNDDKAAEKAEAAKKAAESPSDS